MSSFRSLAFLLLVTISLVAAQTAPTTEFGFYPPANTASFPFPSRFTTNAAFPSGEIDLTIITPTTDFIPFSIQFDYGYQVNPAAYNGTNPPTPGPFPPLCGSSTSDPAPCPCGTSACTQQQTICLINCQMNYVAGLFNCSTLQQTANGLTGQATLIAETPASSVNRITVNTTVPATSPAAPFTSLISYPPGRYCIVIYVDNDDILHALDPVPASIASQITFFNTFPENPGSTFEDGGFTTITSDEINGSGTGITPNPNAIWLNVLPTSFVGPLVSSSSTGSSSSSSSSTAPSSSSSSSTAPSSSSSSSSSSTAPSSSSSSSTAPSSSSSSSSSSTAPSSSSSSSTAPSSSSSSSTAPSSSSSPSTAPSSSSSSSTAPSSSSSSSTARSSSSSSSTAPSSSSSSSTPPSSSSSSSTAPSSSSSSSTAPSSSSSSSTAPSSSSSSVISSSSSSSSSSVRAGVIGDPLFNGLRGQSFQIHGMSDQHYAIISTPSLHVNALFTLLSSGQCTEQIKQRTACWSHTGNYFGALTLLMKPSAAVTLAKAEALLPLASSLMEVPSLDSYSEEIASLQAASLLVSSGSTKAGLTINYAGAQLLPSTQWRALTLSDDSFVFIYFPTSDAVLIITSEFLLRLDNSDHFINTNLVMTPDLAAKVEQHEAAPASLKVLSVSSLPHGLLGQTWSTRTHQSRLKVVEGEVDDYMVEGAKETKFPYSRF